MSSEVIGIHDEIDRCVACRLVGHRIEKTSHIQRGNPNAEVVAIGIAPSAAARDTGKAFAGNSIRRLLKWFSSAGYACTESQFRDSIYLTSLNKCSVLPNTETERRSLWSRCQVFLWRQLGAINPKLIIVLGIETAGLILRDKQMRMQDLIGTSQTSEELFGLELLPPTKVTARWLFLPHPSGLSRTTNVPELAQRVVDSLRAELSSVQFAHHESAE